ncbi:glucose-6-phosphate isomerase [Rhodohalobacter barkolensis]|uniref:Glucose-6-phosphate isomerase n=1 Tax=Rhodohalobacter barkolensis TaxID=2053187 RepID=A0A2N0VKJ9_9BACT|nr:glucose-6-phosphate isomerase [Rhodohalobacter barkolensis]PKD44725.1 glucose-6-phosphate isomerase [Rhodohalobacter barkolensis]
MIKIKLDNAVDFVEESELESALQQAEKAFKQVVDGTGPGNDWLGWRRILAEPNDAEIDQIQQHATKIREDADIFIVCGIGGSFTGAKAIIEALNMPFNEQGPEILFAGHHMSGRYLEQLLKYIQAPKENGDPKSVYLNVISKSGSTLETALAFRTIRKWMHEAYGDEAKSRIVATTGQTGGVLNKIIAEEGYKKYIIPEDIGGRYSVLTPVGLLPVAVAGIDVQTLYYGAVAEFELQEKNPETVLKYSALRYTLHKKGVALDVIGSFEPELMGFAAWTQQLLGESEGKKGKGLFPAIAGYSTDLHSIGQMVQQGQRNMMETLFVVESPLSKMKVPQVENDTDQLNYLDGKLFHDINKSAREGTVQAHREGGVPVVEIILEKLNAQQLGHLIYFYELMTAVYVYMLEVNPFNQPGVENYKQAMYRLLGKR